MSVWASQYVHWFKLVGWGTFDDTEFSLHHGASPSWKVGQRRETEVKKKGGGGGGEGGTGDRHLKGASCSGDFPDSMKNLIGLETLTALSSGLSYRGDVPNQNGDNLPSWLYFDK